MRDRDETLVTIASFPSTFEAALARGALEAIGIRAFVPGEAQGSFSHNRGGIADGLLQVFESDRDNAVAELRRLNLNVVKRSDD